MKLQNQLRSATFSENTVNPQKRPAPYKTCILIRPTEYLKNNKIKDEETRLRREKVWDLMCRRTYNKLKKSPLDNQIEAL